MRRTEPGQARVEWQTVRRALSWTRCGCLLLLLAAGGTAMAAGQRGFIAAPGPSAADTTTRCPAPPQKPGDPELPRVFVDTRMPPVTGETIHVDAGQSLKVALLKARPGDEIVLQAGATFTGPFTLPKKNGDEWIIIRSSASAELPADRRVDPADSVHMATIRTTSAEPAIRTAPGAHHYRLVGSRGNVDRVQPRTAGYRRLGCCRPGSNRPPFRSGPPLRAPRRRSTDPSRHFVDGRPWRRDQLAHR